MLHLVFHSSILINGYIPESNNLDIKFMYNDVLIYSDNSLIMAIDKSLFKKYECDIVSINVNLGDMMNDLKNIIPELKFWIMKGCYFDLSLNGNLLHISFNDDLTLDIPVTVQTYNKNQPVKLPEEIFDKIEQSDNSCKICMDKELCTVNLPCGHLCFCIQCSYKYINDNKDDKCPICQIKLTEIKRIYK